MPESLNPHFNSIFGKALVVAGIGLVALGSWRTIDDEARFATSASLMNATVDCTKSIREFGQYMTASATIDETTSKCPELDRGEIQELKSHALKLDLDDKGRQGGFVFAGVGIAAWLVAKRNKANKSKY